MIGCDPDALDRLASNLHLGSRQIDGIFDELSRTFASLEWSGCDSENFVRIWQNRGQAGFDGCREHWRASATWYQLTLKTSAARVAGVGECTQCPRTSTVARLHGQAEDAWLRHIGTGRRRDAGWRRTSIGAENAWKCSSANWKRLTVDSENE